MECEISIAMTSKGDVMDKAFRRAIANVVYHGDTDIFPFPVENRIIHDKADEVVSLLAKIDADFESILASSPPANHGGLAPVGYTGFRWATQIDPIWNVYFLALVITLADDIEKARLPTTSQCIFSYRFNSDQSSSDLFDRNFGWKSFVERSLELAKEHSYVVSCDISEFYPRLNHHRLDNALRQLPKADVARKKLMDFLSNFSETYSFGIPVGGPASRLLSELTLNQIDRLVFQKQIKFCRFADDFFLFANSEAEAFKALVFLSEILQRNQGLQLQKSKTRIMSSAEFLTTNPLNMDSEDASNEGPLASARQSLFKISLYFDPYSATAEKDYATLKKEIGKFPILDIIKSELSKSRVNISVARKIVATLKFIKESQIDDAAITLIENETLLYPIYYSVLSAVKSSFDKLSEKSQDKILQYVRELIENGSPVVEVDLNRQYAIRLLSEKRSEETVSLFTRLYELTSNVAIRRDIILSMTRWREWIWLSDRRASFRSMRPSERRAFIIASYVLKDEGKHWRDHTKSEFTPFEMITRDWIAERSNRDDWEVPL
jgi:hypothetical protein